MKNELHELEENIGYNFHSPALLAQALSHTSYVNETNGALKSNERLEFLGDAVLELVVSHYLYSCYPNLAEGEMTKLRAAVVSEPTLARRARACDVGRFLRLGKGEETTGGRQRPSILADAFEAVIGAVYLDGGLAAAEEFIRRELAEEITVAAAGEHRQDNKTYLQELLQRGEERRLEYMVLDATGPDHAKVFAVQVVCDGKPLGTGSGRSKKEAEQAAAAQALRRLEAEEENGSGGTA
ncbi:MAG: ribonuclease III [bacterium]|jgi:ribonuclease-3